MNTIYDAPYFTFRTKILGEEFCKRLRDLAYKIDVVTVNDILKDRGEKSIPEGYKYGYNRSEIKKLKPKKDGKEWCVYFSAPKKLVHDEHGYWTTETKEVLNALDAADLEEGG